MLLRAALMQHNLFIHLVCPLSLDLRVRRKRLMLGNVTENPSADGRWRGCAMARIFADNNATEAVHSLTISSGFYMGIVLHDLVIVFNSSNCPYL